VWGIQPAAGLGEAAGVRALDLLDRLACGEAEGLRIAVVAAHPDDEALFAATLMRRAGELVLIHLTDGAPADGEEAARAGFVTPEAYATARRMELDRALDALGVRPRARLAYGLTDQETIFGLPELVERLARDLEGCDAVVTHAYEGGHPDHDAAAAAVQIAASAARFEFAGYHARGGALRTGRFHPSPFAPERIVQTSDADRRARAAALGCYVSQAEPLARLAFAPERVRLAPTYDLRASPPTGEALYDRWGLSLTSADWRAVLALYDAAAYPSSEPTPAGLLRPWATGPFELRWEAAAPLS
jgi:LmbE family N-acetylglucosaminyl deacetylase